MPIKNVALQGTQLAKKPFSLIGLVGSIRKIILIVWVLSIVFLIVNSYLDGGLVETFNYAGGELATPTFQINEQSQEIIQQGGIYPDNGSFFNNIWIMFKSYGALIFAIFNLYIWLRFYKFVALIIFTGDSSRVTSNWLIALAFFFLLQIIFIGFFHTELGLEGIVIPFVAFYNLFKSLPYLLPF